MDRHSFQHHDQTNTSLLDNQNIFDDDFEVEDCEVADGFRPRRKASAVSRSSDDEGIETGPVAPPTSQGLSEPPRMLAASRSSIRKSMSYMDNPFRSAEEEGQDAEDNELHRTQSQRSSSTITYAPGFSHRTTSSASSRAFAHTHSPGLGEAGPSHPYSMYPQNTGVGRTLSTSTTTTLQPSQLSRASTQAPTHPYAMYPQTVDDESEDIADTPNPHHPRNQIPVGFPGMRPQFSRPVDDDTLSINTHMEQLPPYSEYPEDGAPKNVVTPQSATSAQTATTSQSPFLQRTPQSMSDNVPEASGALLADIDEDGETSTHTTKSWKEKTWKEKKKTKFCGIPFGWLLLCTMVVLFIFIVLSSAIGGFLSSAKHHAAQQQAGLTASAAADNLGASSTNSYYDAAPIATSTGPAVPVGTFALRLGAPQEVQDDCLTNQTQGGAWSCDMSGGDFVINVVPQPNGGQGAYVYPASGQSGYSYGAETPQTIYSPLRLVTDLDDPGRGVAYQFQAMYTKIVVAPPNALDPASSSNNKRQYHPHHHVDGHWFTRHQIAAGDQPWFCFWNSTMLEGFIYLTENATTPYNNSGPGPSSWSSWHSSSTSSSASPSQTAQAANSGNQAANMSIYPQVVKIEERRIPGSPPPYCQKMQILNDGQAGPLNDADGNPIEVELNECDPNHAAYVDAGMSTSKRGVVQGACHCQWFSGGS